MMRKMQRDTVISILPSARVRLIANPFVRSCVPYEECRQVQIVSMLKSEYTSKETSLSQRSAKMNMPFGTSNTNQVIQA